MSLNFGSFAQSKRKELKIGLREFCKATGVDPSNWSKIERSLMPAPSDIEVLKRCAKALKLKLSSIEGKKFFDLADISRGMLPKDIIDNEDLLPLLPAFFRTMRGEKPTREELLVLVDLIRNS